MLPANLDPETLKKLWDPDYILEEFFRGGGMWFGSRTKSGEVKKVQVWCFANQGRLEFLTPGDSLKVKRARRDPRVLCWPLGSADREGHEGTAEIVTDPTAVWNGYAQYWRIHPYVMLLLFWPIRRRIQSGRQVLVRVELDHKIMVYR
jgi:hypothetical protein